MTIGNLRQALRMFLLPMGAKSEFACGKALRGKLKKLNVHASDFTSWVSIELGAWRDNGTPSPQLKAVVAALLTVADEHHGPRLARSYFDIHQRLRDEHLMSHEEAVAFLSHAFLVCELATSENLSAAQISRLIGRRDGRVHFSRQSIGTALQRMRMQPEMTPLLVQRLFRRDKALELPSLVDADLTTSAEVVGEAATALGFFGNLQDALKILASDDNIKTFAPYLQILHYQCSIAEYFDHAVTDLYEFSPRGQAALWLFEQYPAALATAGNPFLNNAKSVERLDEQWVRSKKPNERAGAAALFSILSGMQEMGFATRRELARWIRLWLHRIIRFVEPAGAVLPAALQTNSVKKLLSSISQGNTETYGVLEQRIVDALVSPKHTAGDGWRGRGLGDSVNATNTSRRKLGDCDFQHSANRVIAAYEAHGGELSEIYVQEHLRTLKKCIDGRNEELAGIADIGEWTASVTFIAHKVNALLPREVVLQGLKVKLSGITFKDFVESVPLAIATTVVNQYVLVPLQDKRTPEEVRVRILALLQ